MERREMLGILGASAAGLATLSGSVIRAQESRTDPPRRRGGRGEEIVEECARICNETAHHCLREAHQGGEGQHLHLRAHEATMDCQAFCQLTAALSARESRMMDFAHQACADACHQCAEVCEQGQDEAMKRCAEICRRCEEHCRRMSKENSEDSH